MRSNALHKLWMKKTSRGCMLAFAVVIAASGVSSVASAQGILGLETGSPKKIHRAPATTGSLPKAASEEAKSATQAPDGIAFCNQMEAKPLGLKSPNGKSVVQFDKCYRGRLHNVCLAKALTVMISSLQKDYAKLVETNYQAVNSTAGVCAFSAAQLVSDLESARAFTARYKTLVNGYDERLRCTDSILKSLEKASFPDQPNIEQAVKTMSDELKADVATFASERQIADDLMAKVGETQRALEVHTDIHRAMCFTAEASPTAPPARQ